jgi:hypothetical protein
MESNEKLAAAQRLEFAAQRVIDLAGKAPNQNEGWKGSGQCDTCRRQKYCSKTCTAMRNRTKAAVYVALAKALINKTVPVPEQAAEEGQ